MRLLRTVIHWWLVRKADKIEAEFSFGPYPPGTYGAEMLRFASNVRKLAEDVLPGAPKDPRTGGS